MMNRAEMVTPKVVEARLPLLTDRQVQEALRSNIDAIRRSVDLPIRIGRPYGTLGDDHRRLLFSVTGEEFSHLEGVDKAKGKVESDRLQRLGLGVMREFGFDENISRPKYHDGPWTKDGIIDDKDGTSREMRLYPSQTINGLVFQRTKEFITATRGTLSISWSAIDNAPLFRIKLGKKVKN